MPKKNKSRRKGFFAKAKSVYRKNSSRFDLIGLATGAMIYGGTRAKISNALQPITNAIPLGNIADEVAIGAIAYVAHQKVKNKLVRNVARAALTVEAARIGEAIATGNLGIGGGNTSGGTSSGGLLF